MSEPHTSLAVIGRRYTNTWPDGTTRTGYDVTASQNDTTTHGVYFLAEYVAFGKRHGWTVCDPDTGAVILGAGDTTRTGTTRDDALWAMEQHLNRQGR